VEFREVTEYGTSPALADSDADGVGDAMDFGQKLSDPRYADLPTFEIQVAIPPGTSGELAFHLSEPTSPGVPRVPIQPLVDSVTPAVTVPVCTG
jgi:hypothetical protein